MTFKLNASSKNSINASKLVKKKMVLRGIWFKEVFTWQKNQIKYLNTFKKLYGVIRDKKRSVNF
jgi:hypothetical protein